MKKIILAGFCILSIIGGKAQTDTRTDSIVFSKFPEEKDLLFEPVFTLNQGYARKLFLLDTTIAIWNLNDRVDFYFQQYSLSGKRLPGGYIRAGRGSGEVAVAFSGGIHANTFWLHDITAQKLVTARPAKSGTGHDSVILEEYQLPEFYYSMELMDSRKLLGSGTYDSKYKMEEADLQNGKMVRGFGSYSSIPADIPFNSWKSAHESFLFTRPGGDKAVLACRYKDQVEIFDLGSNKSRIINGPENYKVAFNPFYAGGRDVMERTEETRFAFVSGTTTKNFIYLLYSGNHEVEGAGNKNNTGKYIYVFDWEGKPVKKFIVDRYLVSFVVSDDDRIMYAFDPETSAIVKTAIRW